ncbi:PilN domain-containing protein [Actinoplanes sp. CA-252034]|uniref:PilN domain-containing protein n=1 Tax=Actinoplanes sp. CA-252034 TaxID=3239906 RepID=UPI003D97D100
MSTALMPVDPSVSPQQAARVLSIRADLLPPEIRDGRRARRVRTLIAILVLLVVAALGAWYWQAGEEKVAADEAYEEMFQTLTTTRAAQKTDELKALVDYQDGGEVLNKELATIQARDLSWTNLINLIRDEARAENVTLSEITGGLAAEDATATDTSEAGTLTISGSAQSKKVVADYVNKLGTLKHVTNPFVTSVNKREGAGTGPEGYLFSLSVTITDKALCGRFTDDCPSGGK